MQPRARTRRRSSGMSIVEVMVAVVILTIAVYLLSTTVTATIAQTGSKRERTAAATAVMNLLERMRGESFPELFARYNADPNDDPAGPGTAPGNAFAVAGLSPRAGDPDNLVGEIVLPAPGPVLREDAVIPRLSLPRDLNCDLRIDAADHSQDYRVLPVTIRVLWTGMAGKGKLEMSTMFADGDKL